jgi:hypothetical protein
MKLGRRSFSSYADLSGRDLSYADVTNLQSGRSISATARLGMLNRPPKSVASDLSDPGDCVIVPNRELAECERASIFASQTFTLTARLS